MESDIEAGLWATQSESCRCGWAGGSGATSRLATGERDARWWRRIVAESP
ncbi:hypothetical protein ACFZDJ_05900 [Streptomyces sp. NPDC007896]